MGWGWEKYGTEIHARLDEHAGDKEKRDAELWAAFTAECDEALKKITKDPKYAELDLYVDWEEVER